MPHPCEVGPPRPRPGRCPLQEGHLGVAAVDDHPQRFSRLFYQRREPFQQLKPPSWLFVRNVQPRCLGIVGIVFWRRYNMARKGKAIAPDHGCRKANDRVTQMWP